MADKFKTIKCPSCGAPIETPQYGKQVFQCEFCGAMLEDKTRPQERLTRQPPRIVVHSTTTTYAPEVAKQSAKTSCNISCLILGLIVLITGAVFYNFRDEFAHDLGLGTRVYSFGWARKLPSDNDSRADVVGVTRNSDETMRLVYVDFEAEPRLRWQSEPLDDGADYLYNQLVSSQEALYLAFKTHLLAFDRQDGAIDWQATLSDEVTHICQDCLQLFDDAVLALTADGVLSGFDTITGEQIWSVRLNETPRQLLNLAGRAGVADKDEDAVVIKVYDPLSGELLQRLRPECPNEVFSGVQTPRIYDPLFVSQDSQHLYVPIASYRPACLQHWDAAALDKTWQATMPEEVLGSLGHYPYLLAQDALYTSTGNTLYAVSLADGAQQTLFSNEDYNFNPLAAQDGMLVVLAERTRGSRQYSLWGIDTHTGANRWQLNPAAKNFYDGGSDVVYKEGLWSFALVGDEVVLLEAYSNPDLLTFTEIKLADGRQVAANALAIDAGNSNYWLRVLGWGDDWVYLEAYNRVRLIEFVSATGLATWP